MVPMWCGNRRSITSYFSIDSILMRSCFIPSYKPMWLRVQWDYMNTYWGRQLVADVAEALVANELVNGYRSAGVTVCSPEQDRRGEVWSSVKKEHKVLTSISQSVCGNKPTQRDVWGSRSVREAAPPRGGRRWRPGLHPEHSLKHRGRAVGAYCETTTYRLACWINTAVTNRLHVFHLHDVNWGLAAWYVMFTVFIVVITENDHFSIVHRRTHNYLAPKKKKGKERQ